MSWIVAVIISCKSKKDCKIDQTFKIYFLTLLNNFFWKIFERVEEFYFLKMDWQGVFFWKDSTIFFMSVFFVLFMLITHSSCDPFLKEDPKSGFIHGKIWDRFLGLPRVLYPNLHSGR